MAVQFVSERRAEWAPETLSEYTRNDILSALEVRWTTHLAYAELQEAIFDLVWRAKKLPEYARLTEASGLDSTKSAALRRIASAEGPLAANRVEILHILDWIADTKVELDAFCRDFVEVREKKSGRILFEFGRRYRRECLTGAEVRSRALIYCRELVRSTEALRKAGQSLDPR